MAKFQTEEVEKLLEAENAQSSATGKHPMAEILFWRDRSERLSSLFEQLKLGACQKVVEVVERYLQSGPGGEGTESGGRVLGRFKERQSALHKLHLEAKDNVRFLMTLERHLKKLTNGGMTEIAETLPNLLNALRMVWVVSRYYNTDERMEPLLTRIAEQIAGRVNDQISVRALLRRSPVRAGAIVGRCKATLDGWERSYMETRSRIEESGSDHRWEFDRAKLFKRTKYMSKICGDLMEITKVLEQFYKFLGPELKEVTGDPVGIDNLLEEVASSAAAFKTFSECFDERHRKAWDRVMQQFREKTVEIEDKAIVFLDTRFRQLRSAEGAFQLLQNFKSIQSRERINEKMNEKFADIVVQYGNEVRRMTELFQRDKDHPRVAKGAPPVSGAIAWARNILERVKRPIIALRSMQSLLDSPKGQQACGDYVELGKAILKYEKDLFGEWRKAAAVVTATECLNRSILAVERHEGRASSTYVVNLAPELIELMKEAQNFDLIGGFELPGAVLNLALQMDKYKDYAEQLRVMLRGYEEAIGGLTMVQCKVLHTQIADLHKCLRPGLTPLNWNSLGIVDFIESATRGIAAFRNIREQVEKSEERVQAVVESIEQSILVRPFDWTKTDLSPSPSTSTLAEDSVDSSSDYQRVMDVQEFYDYFETHRLSEVEKLVDQYEAIGPFLIKIEETTAGTKSGAAESMREYYAYWERKFFNAITTALVRGLSTFQVLLTSTAAEGNQRPPLIKIRSEFNPPEVVVGSLHGVFKLITKLLQNVLHSSAAFVRWMDGTCLLVPTQSTELDEEKALAFSFYKDVSQNPALIEMTMTIQNSVQQVFQTINKFMRSWKKYDTQWGLWDVKRRQDLERVAVEKKHGLGYFDAHLKVYKNLVETMLEQKRDHDVAFIRVDCSAIITGIRSQAQEWTREYGRILADMASKDLDKIRVEIRDHKDNIDFTPTKLEELKSMLNTISTIEAVHMDMEIRIADVREKYRTLLSYKCKVKAEELSLADRLPDSWRSLKRYSRAKDLALEKSKIEFADITKQEVVDFSAECSKLLDDFSAGGPGTDDVNLEEGAELMRKYQNEMNQRLKRKEELVRSETLFNLPITSYVELVILEKQLKLLTNVYDIYEDHRRMVEEFSNMLWTKIDIGLLERTSDEYDKKVRKKGKELPELKTSVVFKKLEQVVSDFKQSVPLIASLKTEAIKASHWGELMALAGQAGDEDAPIDLSSMTLKSVFALELQRFPDEVNEIRTAATNEMNIENELKRIEAAWRALDLDMGIYKGDRGHVLRGNEELRQTLEDHVLVLQSMSMSKYAVKLMDFIKRWEKNLNVVNEVLSAWLTVQRKWMYLESIFLDSDDIRLQLPEEAKKFDKIHKVFKELMERTASSPNAIQACCANDRLSELKGLTADLDRTQKSLTDYLDTKRALFPRFYFISDDELLSILGSSDPQAVQPHSLKLFDNAKEIVFKPGTSTVIGMVSDEGERWSFGTPVKAVGAVEEWMTKVDDEMKDSLLRLMKEAVYQYPSTPRTKWILSRLGMVVLAGTQIWWTWSIEDTFKRVMEKGDKNAMKRELRKESHELGQLVELIRTDLSSCNRKCVNTLIILDVHARDIVDRFVRDSILDAREFAWESQLRFMWDRRLDDILIKQCTGSFRYCYEYQGLNGRLVITPLTDRCVMTLTTALTFLLGGSPAGPAGTGKTETVKDLAKSLAIRCVVFNCGEGLDFKAMGTIFSGLAEAGFWGCFDEFNRINAEVLSVVSAQIKSIQMGLAQRSPTIELLGRDVTLRSTIGYFITMNPGYAGRTELPDNLKAMFRPVVMIVPDLLMICENMLMSEGFGKAKVLANKMTVLYSLAQGQLSKQYHYDFKLRALKSVLVMAGDLKRSSADLPEDVVLMRALRDMNMPKFVKEDVPLFQGLLSDLFPGLECPRVGYPSLKKAIEEELGSRSMKHRFEDLYLLQVDKVMQLYETMLTRHTTMVVGKTMAGKSAVIECLAGAQKRAFDTPTHLFPINPKMVTVNELYGVLDPATRDWTDGLLSKIFRDINQPVPAGRGAEKRYILYDGDVDAVWVENMNSVMDDNKILTLNNGERIRLEKHCAMLFEVDNLQYASPATISRCGMVYVDDKDLGPAPFYDRWARGKGEKVEKILMEMFVKWVRPCLALLCDGRVDGEVLSDGPLAGSLPRSQVGTDYVVQLSRIFDSMIVSEEAGQKKPQTIAAVFIFTMVWSLGSVLEERTRDQFDNFMKNLVKEKKLSEIGEVKLPKESLYEMLFDSAREKWVPWKERVAVYEEGSPDRDFNSILVPTVDTTRYSWLRSQFARVKAPCLFVGESGTAKSVTIINSLETEPVETSQMLLINFSSRTSSADFQRNIEDNIFKRTGRLFGPEQGKTLRIFVDDLSMPKIDKYGTQQPLALLKFVVEKGFMYERSGDLEKIIIQDVEHIAAMQPPGAGRNSIDPRVVSLYCAIGITFPSTETIDKIYSSILKGMFVLFGDEVRHMALRLPNVTLSLHRDVVENLPRSPSKFHYIFNLRDLSRVYQGVCQADPQVITTAAKLVRLWRHEFRRVYADRLINDSERDYVDDQLMGEIIEKHFPECREEALREPLVFGDFKDVVSILEADEPTGEVRLYEDMTDWKAVNGILAAVLELYNMNNSAMNLVLFVDALRHMTRIHRILRLPQGNALLVGIGGLGKQSLTKLAAFAAEQALYEITLCRGYGDSNLKEDLKALYQAAVKGPQTFLFTDANVVEEGFLEYINNMLTVGMVPALFADDEKESLISGVRGKAKAEGVSESRMWSYCVNHIRSQLHLVLAMSPAGSALRVRCRNFPGLVTCTTIDWFQPWPTDALLAVATQLLAECDVPADNRQDINQFICEAHLSVTTKYSPDFEAK